MLSLIITLPIVVLMLVLGIVKSTIKLTKRGIYTIKTSQLVSARDIKNIAKGAIKVSFKIVVLVIRLLVRIILCIGVLNVFLIVEFFVIILSLYLVIYKQDNFDFISGAWREVAYSEVGLSNFINNSNLESSNLEGSTIGNIAFIDSDKLNYTLKYTKKVSGLQTNVSRRDFNTVAQLIMSSGNVTVNGYGETVSKYLGYLYGGYHYYSSIMPVSDFVKRIADKGNNTNTILKNSTQRGSYKAGLEISNNKTVFMDCSGFAAWFYATVFTAVDTNNKDIDILANWFFGCTSGSDFVNGFLCNEVSMDNVQAGDILVQRNVVESEGHVGVAISGEEYIHAKGVARGITVDKIKSSKFTKAYRPRIEFKE